ncbi:Cupin superfamily protein [Friedmanniella luteola]|uniref:Cupin superfamily protein n=1 Tax=Friedmanniella luteola TaxID=546871 RepID=A0A1H1XEV2_9ACTN|nr:cupin domain-containing protein [Friedmanniella luteola]SDT07661.1 Cupin superfamily protein [Friedmanniella luteola]
MNHTTSSVDARAAGPGVDSGAGGPDGADRTPGARAGRAVLPRLVALDAETFAREHWGRRALLSTAAELPQDFSDLLSADAVDELVSERGLRTPFLRVAKNGTTLAERSFTAPGGVGAGVADQVSDDKLVDLFADGSTMVLQALHRVWPPVLAFCQQLAGELGHPVQANAYVTPPQNQGFSNHYDVHDVFVLQIEGEKRWQIHAPVLESPLRDQPWSDRKAAVAARAAEEPLLEAVLRPGDCLYLPRGFLHAATALGGVSTHLTIGVHSWTRYALAEQLLQQALRTVASDPAVRGSLPLGVDLGRPDDLADDVDAVRAALVAALGSADLERLSDVLHGSARASQRAAPVGPLRQLRTAEHLQPGTVLVLRAHLTARLVARGTGGVVRSRAADLVVDAVDLPAVRRLLETGSATAAELGDELARRLVLGGLVVAG